MDTRHALEHISLLRASGADLDGFLQGQLSTDVTKLTHDRAQLSSFNSPKGRVLAVLHVVRVGDAVLMALPASIAGTVQRRMAMYILRSAVTLETATGFGCFGISGPGAGACAARLTGEREADTDWGCIGGNGIAAWRVPGDNPRYVVAGDGTAADDAWRDCDDLENGHDDAWRCQDVLAGLPEIVPATQDLFVAQMLRLDELGAVDFGKGCYTGQEVIARAHYRGKVKRYSAVGRTGSMTPPEPASVLGDADGNSAATVVSAAPHPDGGQALLAVLHRAYPPGTVLTGADGAAITF